MKQPPAGSVPPVPEGSAAYYGVLFCPPERRPALTALFALERELDRIASPAREASIAIIRLNWWAEELQRLAAGTPRHPVTQTLWHAGAARCRLQPLASMVQISLRLQSQAGHSHRETVELACQRSSALYGFTAEWLAVGHATSPAAIRAAGSRIGAGIRLARFATEDGDRDTTDVTGLAREAIDDGLAAIPAELRATQTPLIVVGILALRQLRKPGAATAGTGRAARARRSLGMIVAAWRAAVAASRGRLPSGAGRPGS
jgi:hypothetical protein